MPRWRMTVADVYTVEVEAATEDETGERAKAERHPTPNGASARQPSVVAGCCPLTGIDLGAGVHIFCLT
jgi:hypothetical protein